MAKKDIPMTPAVRCLRANRIDFKPYFYAYQEHGGALHLFTRTIYELEMEMKTRISRAGVHTPHADGHGRVDGHEFLCQSESCHFPWHKWHP
jgi:hypothetical protein